MSSKWYEHSGEMGEVVVSTRIRLARNMRKYPFVNHMAPDQIERLADEVEKALQKEPFTRQMAFHRLNIVELSPVQGASLVEKHIISPDFATGSKGAVLISQDESVSIMVGEEDHVRLQVMAAGFDLQRAFERANQIDDLLDAQLNYAFDEKLGYLTQCPTNLGTGLRASVMLHLPALGLNNAVSRIANTISKLGLTIRGTFGEGSDVKADLYQLSNQITLGIKEEDAIENLRGIAQQIINQEQAIRDEIKQTDSYDDKVHRALGILQSARILPYDEFMRMISLVRLGISTGTIEGISLDTINTLMSSVGTAALMRMDESNQEAAAQDKMRAQLVREALIVGGISGEGGKDHV